MLKMLTVMMTMTMTKMKFEMNMMTKIMIKMNSQIRINMKTNMKKKMKTKVITMKRCCGSLFSHLVTTAFLVSFTLFRFTQCTLFLMGSSTFCSGLETVSIDMDLKSSMWVPFASTFEETDVVNVIRTIFFTYFMTCNYL